MQVVNLNIGSSVLIIIFRHSNEDIYIGQVMKQILERRSKFNRISFESIERFLSLTQIGSYSYFEMLPVTNFNFACYFVSQEYFNMTNSMIILLYINRILKDNAKLHNSSSWFGFFLFYSFSFTILQLL